MRSARSGFTLIELLIVVAIISVLAAIAVPNFLEAQTRAKVARIKADQRTMATAIESYAVDNNKYPIRLDNWDGDSHLGFPPLREKIYHPDLPTAAIGMHTLTTPIVYITSLPVDIFDMPVKALMNPSQPYYSNAIDYWDPRQGQAWLQTWLAIPSNEVGLYKMPGWTLVSVGPDQHIGTLLAGNPGGYPPETPLTQYTHRFFYDPTNGTISVGNIYRFQADLTQAQILPRPRGF